MACTNLACLDAGGCVEPFYTGLPGQALIQLSSGPAWGGPLNIAIADAGNYFNTDNVEAALQQLGACCAAGIGGVVITGSGIQGNGSGANAIRENFDNLPLSPNTLPATIRFVMANDGANNDGSIATPTEVATLLSPFITAAIGLAHRPWVSAAVPGPTSADSVEPADKIYHPGFVVRGAVGTYSTGAEFENINNLANGAGNHTLTGSNNLVTGRNNSIRGGEMFAAGVDHLVVNSNFASSIAGGQTNVQSDVQRSIIGAGQGNNQTNTFQGGILAGNSNLLNVTVDAAIGAGQSNAIANNDYSFIGAGRSNQINNNESFIGSGNANAINGNDGFIGSGVSNSVRGVRNGIVVGASNSVTANASNGLIGAGTNNILDTSQGFIGAGQTNEVRDSNSAVVAGNTNAIDAQFFGANLNTANNAFIGAGSNNVVAINESGIVAGNTNYIYGVSDRSFIGAGNNNAIITATDSAIAGGSQNQIGAGSGGFIGAGSLNLISNPGNVNSVALGTRSFSAHTGTFVWQSNSAANFTTVRANEFIALASGGFRLRSNVAGTVGVDLPTGTNAWVAVSDAALKGMFKQVDGQDLLQRLLNVPIQTYQFLDGLDSYHQAINIGPTAQDWNAQFAGILGEKTVTGIIDGNLIETPAISEGDKIGVLLAVVQELGRQIQDLKDNFSSRVKRKA